MDTGSTYRDRRGYMRIQCEGWGLRTTLDCTTAVTLRLGQVTSVVLGIWLSLLQQKRTCWGYN